MIFTAFALDGPLAGGVWQSDSNVLYAAEYTGPPSLIVSDDIGPMSDWVHKVRYNFARVFLSSPRTVPSDAGIPMPNTIHGNVWWANQIALDHAVATLRAMALMMRWLG